MPKLVSIVTTFRNEEAVLEELIRRVESVFRETSYGYEIVFVNDASSDRSLKLLAEAHARNPRIKVATTSRRFGVYACMMAGLRLASGDCAIYLDCDLQDPPEQIPIMLAAWERGADLVHMRRSRRLGEPWLHVKIVHLAYRLINLISVVDIPPDVGDFKLYSRTGLTHLCAMRESYPYIRGLAAWIGFNQIILDYERAPRSAGESKRAGIGLAALRVFANAIVGYSGVPIYALGVAAIVSLVIAGGWLIAGSVANDTHDAPLWAVGLWFGLSIVLASNFVLGLYVHRIWQEVLRRPSCIIRTNLGFGSGTAEPEP